MCPVRLFCGHIYICALLAGALNTDWFAENLPVFMASQHVYLDPQRLLLANNILHGLSQYVSHIVWAESAARSAVYCLPVSRDDPIKSHYA